MSGGWTWGFLGGIGSLFWLIMTALALLTPIMVYLIQRNTYDTREYVKKTNELLEQLLKTHNDHPETQEKQPATEADSPERSTVSMDCEHCGKPFKYGINHSGKYKKCPGCDKIILLK